MIFNKDKLYRVNGVVNSYDDLPNSWLGEWSVLTTDRPVRTRPVVLMYLSSGNIAMPYKGGIVFIGESILHFEEVPELKKD